MKEALDHGVDMIETDLNITKDKEIVIIHDNTVNRTTNGTGFVHDMTLEEIKKLDAGSYMNEAFRGLQIPTLREFCDYISGHKELLLNVEMKEYNEEYGFELVDLSFQIIKEYGLWDRCVFTCFDANIIEYMYDNYGAKCQGFPKEYMYHFKEGESGTYSKLFAVGIGMTAFDRLPNMPVLTNEVVEYFHSINIQPWCFCPNTLESVDKSISCGARLMTCDNPLPALSHLKTLGLHPRNICNNEWNVRRYRYVFFSHYYVGYFAKNYFWHRFITIHYDNYFFRYPLSKYKENWTLSSKRKICQ